MKTNFGVIILAGGKSERMKFPKPFLMIDEKIFLKKIAEEYIQAGIKNSCLVINKEYCEGKWKKDFESIKPYVTVIEKTNPDSGRFHSIKLGIKNFPYADFVFIQNADNPFVDIDIINSLKKHRFSLGYTQLFHKGQKGHPVLISKKVIQKINVLKGDDYNLRNILEEFPSTEVEVNDKRILANLNTIEEYKKFIPLS